MFKAIDDCEAKKWFDEKRKFGNEHLKYHGNGENVDFPNIKHSSMGAFFSGDIIKNLLNKELIITPVLDENSQIGSSSFDFRLGNVFITTRRARLTAIDPLELEIDTMSSDYLAKSYIPFGKPFILHEGQIALASSLEFLSLPDNMIGLIVNRLAWARLGLVNPVSSILPRGFHGTISLEIWNMGNAPIRLYPGSRIGQVILSAVSIVDESNK